MNLYLLEGIPVVAKHTAVLYLLFDLMHLEENTDLVSLVEIVSLRAWLSSLCVMFGVVFLQMPERVGSFLSTFNISQSLAKLVQGLWSIDHKRFDVSAFPLLLPPPLQSL